MSFERDGEVVVGAGEEADQFADARRDVAEQSELVDDPRQVEVVERNGELRAQLPPSVRETAVEQQLDEGQETAAEQVASQFEDVGPESVRTEVVTNEDGERIVQAELTDTGRELAIREQVREESGLGRNEFEVVQTDDGEADVQLTEQGLRNQAIEQVQQELGEDAQPGRDFEVSVDPETQDADVELTQRGEQLARQNEGGLGATIRRGLGAAGSTIEDRTGVSVPGLPETNADIVNRIEEETGFETPDPDFGTEAAEDFLGRDLPNEEELTEPLQDSASDAASRAGQAARDFIADVNEARREATQVGNQVEATGGAPAFTRVAGPGGAAAGGARLLSQADNIRRGVTIIGGVAAGAAGIDAVRNSELNRPDDRDASEIPVSPGTQDISEVGVPEDQATGEVDVPDDGAFGGGELRPSETVTEQSEVDVPTDEQGGNGAGFGTDASGSGTGGDTSDSPGDLPTPPQPELPEPGDTTGDLTDEIGRGFPTGGDAVVGEGSGDASDSVSDAQQRRDEATGGSGFGQGTDVGFGSETGIGDDTGIGTEPETDVGPDTDAGVDVGPGAGPDFETPTDIGLDTPGTGIGEDTEDVSAEVTNTGLNNEIGDFGVNTGIDTGFNVSEPELNPRLPDIPTGGNAGPGGGDFGFSQESVFESGIASGDEAADEIFGDDDDDEGGFGFDSIF